MLPFMENKKVTVKRYSSTLGEYNRPVKELKTVGIYPCCVAEGNSSTSQKQPQKENTTDLTLYTEPEADIKTGDVLYIYELNEYNEIMLESELKVLADKPYKKRTHLAVPLISTEEV